MAIVTSTNALFNVVMVNMLETKMAIAGVNRAVLGLPYRMSSKRPVLKILTNCKNCSAPFSRNDEDCRYCKTLRA